MSVLKKVYEARNAADARLLRGLLESEGIPAVVRGAGLLSSIEIGRFRIGNPPSVWVLETRVFRSRCASSTTTARTPNGPRRTPAAHPEERAAPADD